MAKKNWKPSEDSCCETCALCESIGEGDHICTYSTPRIVLDEYSPAAGYYWCGGEHWEER